MKLMDEFAFFKTSKSNYYIRYDSSIKRIKTFLEYIKDVYDDSPYKHQEDNTNELNIDELNEFLATHYFTRETPQDMVIIKELNELANDYIKRYNLSIYNSLDENHDNADTCVLKAQSLLQSGVTRIECINVAQANFSVGYTSNDSPVALFDIGVSSSVANNRWYVENRLKQVDKNGIVIISHYDYDHINGYRYLGEEAFKRIWILPQRRLSPTPAERNLLSLLTPNNCIFLKDVNYSMTPYNANQHVLKIGNISIYQGNSKKKDPYQSTDENARSLICLVKGDKSILLPGDCLYEEFPTYFDVQYLVVPHHCCHYDQSIPNLHLPSLNQLIVFAGPNRRYKHPNISHLNRLNQNQCQVIFLMNHNVYHFFHKRMVSLPIHTLMPMSHSITL